MKSRETPHCHAGEPSRRRWWQDQALWGVLLVIFTLGLGQVWAPARPVARVLWGYLSMAGWAVLLGLFLGGLIEQYVPKEYITRWLTGKHHGTILASAGLGFLASSCSHGCLALTMELYKKGASVPAVLTFLLASPWASLSLTLLIVSLMGWKGLLIVAMALVVAIITGIIFQQLERRGLVRSNPHTVQVAAGFSIRHDMKNRLRNRPWTLLTILSDLKGILKGSWELA